MSEPNPIDAVVTWVDGSDPRHREKRDQQAARCGQAHNSQTRILPAGIDATRFHDNGELQLCIDSIYKFAPWIRTIHLVTDNQIPNLEKRSYSQPSPQISICDHTDVFHGYEAYLPTFNSLAIEAMLWKIPHLSERFIYFNDDVLLMQPVQPHDFFCNDHPVLRGQWARSRSTSNAAYRINRILNRILSQAFGITRTMNLYNQIEGAKQVGFTCRYFQSLHVPHPLRRSTSEDHFNRHPKLLNRSIQHRFRTEGELWPISLANHLEIKQSSATLAEHCRDAQMLNGEKHSARHVEKLIEAIRSRHIRFLCLQSLERLDSDCRQHLLDFLSQHTAPEKGD